MLTAWVLRTLAEERDRLRAALGGMVAAGRVCLQQLNDVGLNQFAATLLVESWQALPSPRAVSFVLRGVRVVLTPEPEAKEVDRVPQL
jgi:hypothetical protein